MVITPPYMDQLSPSAETRKPVPTIQRPGPVREVGKKS